MFGKKYFVYILASKKDGTLYVGVTNDLKRRMAEHKNGLIPGFTRKHKVELLVYFETFDEPRSAIAREKRIKGGSRVNKVRLIEKNNPVWRDLLETL